MEIERRIKDLPEIFQELAIENQIAQNKEANLDIKLIDGAVAFTWSDSPQGSEFWVNVFHEEYGEAVMLNKCNDKLLVVEGSPRQVIFYSTEAPKKSVYPLSFENMEEVVAIITEYRDRGFKVHKYKKYGKV